MKFKRIVSLTPSITEILFSLKAEEQLVGVTDACDYPFEVNSKPHVCSWFDPDMERLEALKPDLVIGLETAHGRLVPSLADKNIHCQFLNPITIGDALDDILKIGTFLGVEGNAQSLVDKLLLRLSELDKKVVQIPSNRRQTVSRVLDIDEDELIVAGPQSFQYDVIGRAGGINVTSSYTSAYPKVPFQQFSNWDPEMIFICGTDASYLSRLKKDKRWRTLTAVRNNRFYQFDCGFTCRTSPRIVDMTELLFQTLYGNIFNGGNILNG